MTLMFLQHTPLIFFYGEGRLRSRGASRVTVFWQMCLCSEIEVMFDMGLNWLELMPADRLSKSTQERIQQRLSQKANQG